MRHKVFVSYHHANDQYYKELFDNLFSNIYDIMVSKSVQIGDIDSNLPTERIRQKIRDEYLRDSTVTVVLIGSETWKRKHVDWEIGSSIRQTEYSSRSGLLGIILPTYPRKDLTKYDPYTIPPRLYDNIHCNFARIYNWDDNPYVVQKWIHDAFDRRNKIIPDNSFPSFTNNRNGDKWQK
ncbi:TIR domain-containing protein [Aliarcobacter butzleri]|uniref:TIR domain-containing protein n=1 Tax=Aliarcobacter butzleri TaxID=28197 RepID=UPI003AE165C8